MLEKPYDKGESVQIHFILDHNIEVTRELTNPTCEEMVSYVNCLQRLPIGVVAQTNSIVNRRMYPSYSLVFMEIVIIRKMCKLVKLRQLQYYFHFKIQSYLEKKKCIII